MNDNNTQHAPLLQVRHLKKWFPMKKSLFTFGRSYIKAVDDVSFNLEKGETLGVVGESGCGKSTMGRTVLRLIEPTSGSVIFKESDLIKMRGKELHKTRSAMQIIFQDPYASLNPRMTVGEIIAEPLDIQLRLGLAEKRNRVLETMQIVGLNAKYYNRYPHEFSGGQRQRIGIARALILKPALVICDEPISALDVSIQAQIVNLLKDFQEESGCAYLFIAHDLSMVRYVSDEVGVMYLGQLVEIGEAEEIYERPLHPYTKGLLESIPIADPKRARKKEKSSIEGDIPSPIHPPSGCRFHTRCPFRKAVCEEEQPPLKKLGNAHFCACHLYD